MKSPSKSVERVPIDVHVESKNNVVIISTSNTPMLDAGKAREERKSQIKDPIFTTKKDQSLLTTFSATDQVKDLQSETPKYEKEAIFLEEFNYISPGSTKNQWYDLMKNKSGVFLPDFNMCSCAFMRQILCGKKKYIKAKDVIPYSESKFKGIPLQIGISKWGEEVKEYLPDFGPLTVCNRSFFYSLVNTLVRNKRNA